MALRSTSAGVTGTGTTAAVPVPTGAAIGDIVVVFGFLRDNADAVTPPAGFTQKQIQNNTAITRGQLIMWWKRLTAADTGTHDFTWTNSAVYQFSSMAFSGRIRYGDPFSATATAINVSTTALTQAVSVTTLTPGEDLVVGGSSHATNAGGWTAPASMTETYDTIGTSNPYLNMNVQENVAAGAYSKTVTSVSGTTGSTYIKIISGGLMADRVTRTGETASGALGSPATPVTVTLPTHVTGGMILIAVSGKLETAGIPTIDQGFTLIKSGTGGDAAGGFGMFMAVYAKIAASASETNPTITAAGTTPNCWLWTAAAFDKAVGKDWLNTIGSNVNWVEIIADTAKTSTHLTGTSTAFTNQPTSLDALHLFAAADDDTSTSLMTGSGLSITATGLAGGVAPIGTYTETSQGSDTSAQGVSVEGWTGTLSSGVSFDVNPVGYSNASGVIAVVSLRQGIAPSVLSIAGTIPQPTMAFSLTGFNDSAVSIAGVIPQPVGAFTLTGFNDSEIGVVGAIPLPVGAINLAVTPVDTELTVAGVIPLPVGAFSLTGFNDSEISIVGVIPQPVGAFSLTGFNDSEIGVVGAIPLPVGAIDLTVEPVGTELTIAGVIPLPVGEFSLDSGIDEAPPVETDSDVVDDGPIDQAAHEAEWHADVAVDEPDEPLPIGYDTLHAYTSISLTGTPLTQPVVVDVVEIRKPKLRDRILVGGVDVTFYNGVRTPTPDYSLYEPFTYGVCTLIFPQIFPLIQVLSAITWLRRGSPVIIQRIDEDGNVVATDYRGRIMGWDTSGDFMVSVGGMFSGPASVRFRPQPMVRRIEDVNYWLMTAFRHQRLPLVYDEDFGVGLISRGENYYMDHCLELCALGVKRNGSQITVHYDEDLMKWVAAPKDTTTIHATVYFDAGNMNPALTRDFTVETDEVFATAHLSDGTQILNSVWPGMQQEDPIPDYPGVLEEGDNNEDVAVLIARLVLLGYLKYIDRPGGFDEDVVDAILSAREDADQLGSGHDEELDEDLWNWLWDLDATGYTDKEARILPMAQRRKVRQWDRSATGNRLGINSFYDPVYATLTVSQKLELGHVKSKNHAKKLAGTLIEYGLDNWVGTLSSQMSFVRGEHTPGDPITEADLMSGREFRPGMNLWAPLFQGGTLFHVSSIDITNDGNDWSMAIDTRNRDAMQIDGILERNRENRTSPARAFWNARSSSSASDTIFNHDEHFGILGSNIPLPAGEWVVYPVPAGDFGTVSHTIMRTIDDPAEFSMMVFQKKVTSAWLTARAANPLNSADEWWADEDVRADFKDRGIKYAAGSEEDPCGYFPGRKSRGHALTGRWEDEAEFAYGGDSLVFWVCIYADRISKLKRGEQFDVQRELGT